MDPTPHLHLDSETALTAYSLVRVAVRCSHSHRTLPSFEYSATIYRSVCSGWYTITPFSRGKKQLWVNTTITTDCPRLNRDIYSKIWLMAYGWTMGF
jgi:hypothetical protein